MNKTIDEAAKELGVSRCNLRLRLIELKLTLKKTSYINHNYTLYGAADKRGRRVIMSVITPDQFELIKSYIESRRVAKSKKI